MNLENAILPITIILTDEAGYIDQELNIEYSEWGVPIWYFVFAI